METVIPKNQTSSFKRKLLKFGRIALSVIAIVVCGYFLIVGVSTYVFLSSIEQNKSPTKNVKEEVSVIVPSDEIDKPSNALEEKSPKQNLLQNQELAREGRLKQGMAFINKVIELRKDSRLAAAPPICEILCASSTWRKPDEGVEIWDHFNSFIEKEGSRAFDDPKFRLVFELANSYADILQAVEKTLEIFEPLKKKIEWSAADKIYWSAKAPGIIAELAMKVTDLAPRSEKQRRVVKKFVELNKQCDERSVEEIQEACRTLSAGFAD